MEECQKIIRAIRKFLNSFGVLESYLYSFWKVGQDSKTFLKVSKKLLINY